MTDDLLTRAKSWLVQCGPCDYGMPEFACTCQPGDPRLVISDLVAEIERLRLIEQGGAK